MELNEKLASLRKQHGFTQLDLADQLHVSRQAISRWESGSAVPSTDNLKILTKLYGVSLDYLLHDIYEDVQHKEENVVAKSKYRKIEVSLPVLAAACVLILALTGALLGCVIKMWQDNPNRIIPMEDMETIMEDDYPVYIVDLE